MAEFLMKELVKERGKSEEYFIRSSATSSEELNPSPRETGIFISWKTIFKPPRLLLVAAKLHQNQQAPSFLRFYTALRNPQK